MIDTRYFGGIKLGAGGLRRNYAKTTKLAVNEAQIVEYIEKKEYLIDFSYGKSNEIDKIVFDEKIEILDRNFDERVSYKMLLSQNQKEKIQEIKDIIVIGV